MADLTSYPAGTAAQDTLLIGTQVNVPQADGTKRNLTRNFSISNVASLSFDGGYKVYTALLTQAGNTAADIPIATILQNTTGGTIAWTRTGAGAYTATISDALFTLNKTMVFINGGSATATANIEWASPTRATVTLDTTADSVLTGASLEIRIYV